MSVVITARPEAEERLLVQRGGENRSLLMIYLRRLRRNRPAILGSFTVLLLFALAILGPWLARHDPILVNTADRFLAPNATYWFGTDEFGRDIFSRVLYGARIAVRVGAISVIVSFVGGIVLGLLCGYFGGWVDIVLSRVMEIWLAVPDILFCIAVVATLGPSLNNVIISLAFLSLPAYGRIVRASVLSAREEIYIESARAIGASNMRIMTHHILPNVVAPLIVLSSMRFGSALLTGAGLSFIGLGAQPPEPEWGAILSQGRTYMYQAPWIATFPGLTMAFFVLGINMLGDGLRDVLDPRLDQ